MDPDGAAKVRTILQVDTGGGFGTITGTVSYDLLIDSTEDFTSIINNRTIDVSDGDVIRLMAQRVTGSATITTVSNANVFELRRVG